MTLPPTQWQLLSNSTSASMLPASVLWNTAATTTTSSGGTSTWINTTPSLTYGSTYAIDYGRLKLQVGANYELPDGSKLCVDDKGNYRIEDKDAKVTYQANRMREFSPHLNASDMLAKFVDYVRKLGVKQGEVLGLPIELFINWLIIEAAERDNDQIPENVVRVEKHPKFKSALASPQCFKCGRFIPVSHHQNRFPFCNVEHAALYLKRMSKPVNPLRIAHQSV